VVLPYEKFPAADDACAWQEKVNKSPDMSFQSQHPQIKIFISRPDFKKSKTLLKKRKICMSGFFLIFGEPLLTINNFGL